MKQSAAIHATVCLEQEWRCKAEPKGDMYLCEEGTGEGGWYMSVNGERGKL